ncbi:hypothetical protein HPC49_19535 [Pyxidicoccus fallax]|uniref:Outer membrane protein beta-barrel domain-containing protein n=2 Tax=Pyxidicoccus fallax TaxID=394095 RepID=A0A848LTW0_9BACT|nr:hypothetical protein [Pyxidicoccus fallax]NPC80405.1 hypothetical protein [Pyxidicoccus fallax]
MFLLSSAGRAQGVDAPLVAPVPKEPRAGYALWTSSLLDWGLMLTGPFMGVGLHLALPVGLNVRRSDTTDWVFEVTPGLTSRRCIDIAGDPAKRCGKTRSLEASVGLAWTPRPGARGDGLFLQPRVGGMWIRDEAGGTELQGVVDGGRRTETGGQVTLGLDIGYRKTAARSRSFLAPVVGVGVGYGWNQRRNPVRVTVMNGLRRGSEWKDQLVVDVNLEVLRWGATF